MAATNSPIKHGLEIFRSKAVADAYMALNQGVKGILESNPEAQYQQAIQQQKQRLAMAPTLGVPDEYKNELERKRKFGL